MASDHVSNLPKEIKLNLARRNNWNVHVDRIGHMHIGGDDIVTSPWEYIRDEIDRYLWLLEGDTTVHVYTRYTMPSRWDGDVFDVTWDMPPDELNAFIAEVLSDLNYVVHHGEELR
jgi:hypothetical protein